MGLRERLETKARRTATIQVAVEDTGAAQQQIDAARSAYLTALVSDPPVSDEEQAARHKDLEAAEAILEDLFVDVVLQALPPGDYEALIDAHTQDDGDLDRVGFLAPAVAASAVDEDLQDEAWWIAQLGSPRWADGERATLFLAISALNDPTIRSAAVPKD